MLRASSFYRPDDGLIREPLGQKPSQSRRSATRGSWSVQFAAALPGSGKARVGWLIRLERRTAMSIVEEMDRAHVDLEGGRVSQKARAAAARPPNGKGSGPRAGRGPHGGGGQGPGNVYGGERGARKGRPSTAGARRPRLGSGAQGAKRGGAGRGALSKTAAGRKRPQGPTPELLEECCREQRDRPTSSSASLEFRSALRRTMAATYELDVSLAVDDLGSHLGTDHHLERN